MAGIDIIANQPVVIDNGSGIIKAGFAGNQIPKCYFPNFVGRPKYTRVMIQSLDADVFIGHKADEHRGVMYVSYPMENGIVTDWNDMEKVWRHIYSKEQLNTYPEDHPLLLTEAPLSPLLNREKTAEIFFEVFNVPALFMSMQAVLGLYATGRTTGVVLDSGDGVSHCVSVYEGFGLTHGITRINLAGRDVTSYLSLLLRKEGFNFHTSAEFQVVRNIKEKLCYFSKTSQVHEQDTAPFVLPDGKRIEIGSSRFKAPEVLFHPELVGSEWQGIDDILVNAITKSDVDIRGVMYQNIVLSGGSTLFKGFGDRLLTSVKRIAPKEMKIRISAPQERLYAAWIGGSILASLDMFRKIWVSKQEYEEEGVAIIHRKTF